jgi:hypothetical protein
MSQNVLYQPFKINEGIFPIDEYGEPFNKQDIQNSNSFVDLSSTNITYLLRESQLYMSNIDSSKQQQFDKLLNTFSLKDPAFVDFPSEEKSSEYVKKLYETIIDINQKFTNQFRQSAQGTKFVEISQQVWARKYQEYNKILKRLLPFCSSDLDPKIVNEFGNAPTTQNYEELVRIVKSFLRELVQRVRDTAMSAADKTKYMRIVENSDIEIGKIKQSGASYAELLIKNMFFVTSVHRGASVDDDLRLYDLWNMCCWRIFPLLDQILFILELKLIEQPKIQQTQFLELIHSPMGVLSLNENLLRYLKDIGVDDYKASELSEQVPTIAELQEDLDKVQKGQTKEIYKLHHYAVDLYQTYKLIIRDTILYQFRGSSNKMPSQIALAWDTQIRNDKVLSKFGQYEHFLNELLFMDLKTTKVEDVNQKIVKPIIGDDVMDFNTLQKILSGSLSKQFEPCNLSVALRNVRYVELLKEIAMDSNSNKIQIRTETLLKYICTFAFESLRPSNTAATTVEFRAISLILDAVAEHLVGMQQIIKTVFDILHAYGDVYSAPDQMNESEVFTFIKIRNDNDDFGNRRFDIMLDSDHTTMILKYEDNDVECYRQLKEWKKMAKNLRDKGKPAPPHPSRKFYTFINNKVRERVKQMSRDISEAQNRLAGARTSKSVEQRNKAVKDLQELDKKYSKLLSMLNTNAESFDSSNIGSIRELSYDWPNKLDESLMDTFVSEDSKTSEDLIQAYDPRNIIPRGPRSTYVFGPFTKIYTPNEDAQSIATATNNATMQNTVLRRLRDRQDVCIFGYGQSGSGKTSILIYFKKNKDDSGDDGIMSRLCEQLIGTYGAIECTIKEIGTVEPGMPTKSGKQAAVVGDSNAFYTTKLFLPTTQGGSTKWVMRDEDFQKLPPLKRVVPIEGESLEINKTKLKDLAAYAFFATENNRLTKATTNNPTSSRSHIFIFLKFKNLRGATGREPTLIIGDFAGVENRFACGESAVSRAFAKIKFDNRNAFAYQETIDESFKTNMGSLLDNVKIGNTDISRKPFSKIEQELESEMDDQLSAEEDEILSTSADELRASTVEFLQSTTNAGRPISTIFAESPLGRCIKACIDLNKNISLIKMLPARIKVSAILPNQIVPILTFLNKSPDSDTVYRALFASSVPSRTSPDAWRTSHRSYENIISMSSGEPFNMLDQLLYYCLKATSELGLGAECSARVIEGDFINKSLSVFRNFLADSLKRRGAVPKILNQCGAIQCNPFYNDCFGSSFKSQDFQVADMIDIVEQTMASMLAPPAVTLPDGTLINNPRAILERDGSPLEKFNLAQQILKDMTYAVFNVINISKDRNDPPPTPFIDASAVIFEYNRASSYPSLTHGEKGVFNPSLDAPFYQSDLINASREDIFDVKVLEQLKSKTVFRKYLSGTLTEGTKGAAISTIDNAINNITSGKRKNEYMPLVRKVIDEFEKINAPTFIGTMIFADTMAKFGINRMMCILESDAYQKDMSADQPSFMDRMVFGNIGNLLTSARSVAHEHLLKISNFHDIAKEASDRFHEFLPTIETVRPTTAEFILKKVEESRSDNETSKPKKRNINDARKASTKTKSGKPKNN